MHTVLITGVTGFVGRALAREMIAEGRKVMGTVRSATDVAGLPDRVEAIQIRSFGPDTAWSKALIGVETIVHLAARVHVMNDAAADPLSAFRQVNVAGTEHLARMSAKAGVRRFVYLSSIKVNGEGGPVSYTEQDAPAPQDPYGISKWEAEQVLQKIAAETGLEVVILRAPLVYGPGVKANFLRMVDLVYRGIPLPLSSINNCRSLIYLGNLVNAIMTCITLPDAAGETFLVSDGQNISTPGLLRLLASAMGKKPRLIPFPPDLLKVMGRFLGKSAEIQRLTGSLLIDSSKIRKVLGWKPPFTVEEGIRETVKWYKNSSRLVRC